MMRAMTPPDGPGTPVNRPRQGATTLHILPEVETLQPEGRGAIGRWVREVVDASGTRHLVIQGRGFRPAPEARFFRGSPLLARAWKVGGRKGKLAQALLAPLVVAANLALLPWRDVAVIQVHNRPSYMLALRALSALRRRRPLLVLHLQNDHLQPLSASMRGRVARNTDLILTCSRHLRDVVRTQVPGQVEVVYNGTVVPAEAAVRGQGPGPVIVTFVGRMVPDKGVHVLIEAFERLVGEGLNAELHLVGGAGFSNAPSAYWDELRARTAGRPEIVWHGYQPSDAAEARMRESDVLVCPSVWAEPFGMVIVEGMAHGNCVIASRVGGIPEIIEDGVTGLLVEADDAGALADALRRVIQDPALRTRLAQAGWAAVGERFSWAEVARSYDQTIRAALDAPRPDAAR